MMSNITLVAHLELCQTHAGLNKDDYRKSLAVSRTRTYIYQLQDDRFPITFKLQQHIVIFLTSPVS